MRTVLVISAALLAACTAEPADESGTATNAPAAAETAPAMQDPGGGPPAPPSPPPAAPGLAELTGLTALSDQDVRAALGTGARCTLTDGGTRLMVATVGDALVKDGGRVVHLSPAAQDWTALTNGGHFAGAGFAIQVAPSAVIQRDGGLIEREASVSIARGGRGFATSHGPRWRCESR